MSSLTKEDWDFIPACESNLLWYVLLVEKDECLALNWHWIRRGKNVLSALFDNHIYSSLILHHNLKNGSF